MEFKKDKLAIIFLIILLAFGAYLRFADYDTIGYPHDSLLTVAGSVAWFYPLDYFPGLIYMGPPLGNIIIGSGCMLSGQDFSGISNAHQLFSPDIPILVGQQMVDAEPYCKSPIYIFGLIFFLLASLLAILLLKDYSALYPIAFFTFSQFILEWSRVISVDVISYGFIFAGLIFLWKAYSSEKLSKKENIYFILTFISFGFAGATKLSAGIYLLFSFVFIVEKYWEEIKSIAKKILSAVKVNFAEKIKVNQEITNIKKFTTKVISYIIFYVIALLIPYKLNLGNLKGVLIGFRSLAPDVSSFGLNKWAFGMINNFLMRINIFDLLILIFSVYIFIKLILKKQKVKEEKFILYLVLLFLFTALFFESTSLLRVAIPFLISLILLMGLAFSNKEYSLFSAFKIPAEKRKKFSFIFLFIYILYSALITVPHEPYYYRGNEIVCMFEKENCDQMIISGLYSRSIKQTVNFLNPLMNENETFLYLEGAVVQVYGRQNDSLQHLQFDNYVYSQVGRYSTIPEKIEYFKPDERDIRYFIPTRWYESEESDIFKKEYVPNYLIRLNNKDVIKIYDIYNLTKK